MLALPAAPPINASLESVTRPRRVPRASWPARGRAAPASANTVSQILVVSLIVTSPPPLSKQTVPLQLVGSVSAPVTSARGAWTGARPSATDRYSPSPPGASAHETHPVPPF